MTKSKTKLWLERMGLALITILALGSPLLCGVVAYIGMRPAGIFINEGNPLREMHIWMQHERRGPVGVGVQTVSAEAGTNGDLCARTNYRFVRWSPVFQVEGNSDTCQCYAMQSGQLRATKNACK